MTKEWKMSIKPFQEKINRFIISSFLIILTSPFGRVKAQSDIISLVKTGVYDHGRLVVSRNDSLKLITGILNAEEDDITCRLYFSGKVNKKGDISISIFNPVDKQPFQGVLKVKDKIITIKADEVIFPCQRFLDLAGMGQSFELTDEVVNKRLRLAMIKTDRALLYDRPNVISNKRPYLICGDVVAIRRKNGDWVETSYLKNPKLIRWIKTADVVMGE